MPAYMKRQPSTETRHRFFFRPTSVIYHMGLLHEDPIIFCCSIFASLDLNPPRNPVRGASVDQNMIKMSKVAEGVIFVVVFTAFFVLKWSAILVFAVIATALSLTKMK
jgi:hypothetical protein